MTDNAENKFNFMQSRYVIKAIINRKNKEYHEGNETHRNQKNGNAGCTGTCNRKKRMKSRSGCLFVGICGSDIHYYVSGQIGSQVVEYPFAVGHEGAGVVIETGKDVKRVRPGDVIAIDPAIAMLAV